MNLQRVNIGLLRPYWRNPRNIEDAVEAVTKSIQEYNYQTPIAVDENYTIVVGHARYRALQRLGYGDIDVVVLDLPPDKIREYRIADNKSAELAEWDDDRLVREVMEINDPEFARTFFSDRELYDLLGESYHDVVPVDPLEDKFGGHTPGPVDDNRVVTPQVPGPGVQEDGDGNIVEDSEEEQVEEEPKGEVEVEVMCPKCGADQTIQVSRKVVEDAGGQIIE